MVDAAEEEYSDAELAENDRLNDGQANKAGGGDKDGDGEESLVCGGDPYSALSPNDVVTGGLRVRFGGSSFWMR